MKSNTDVLAELKEKVDLLINKNDELAKDKQHLIDKNKELIDEINNYKNKTSDLEESMARMSLTTNINQDEIKIKVKKERINELIKEIDKHIAVIEK